jgi:hypothetical protein
MGVAATLPGGMENLGSRSAMMMDMISRAAKGQTWAMRRLSMVLKENVTQANLADVLRRRSAQGMQMEAEFASTLAGQLIQLHHSWSEILKDIGEILVKGLHLNEVFSLMLDGIRKLKEYIAGLDESKRKWIVRVLIFLIQMNTL